MNKTEKLLQDFIENLKKTFGERLTSVILYGSCAVEGCDTSKSDINSIVVIDGLNGNDLEKANIALKKWLKTENPLPIFFDRAEWFNSSDVYPIEYSDIKERYRILHGEDIVAPLQVEHRNLRHQCEYEVKNLLIKLRETYIAECTDSKTLEIAIKSGSKTLIALSRAILRLTNESVPAKHEEVINHLAAKVGIDGEFLLKTLAFRKDKKVFSKKEYGEIVKKLIDTTDFILKYVDKLGK